MKEFTKDIVPYFDKPRQVMFYDADADPSACETPYYHAGIAYKDEIICSCCGGVFPIKEVWENGIDNDAQPIFVFSEWLDIDEAIVGDVDITEYPQIADEFFSSLNN